MFEWVDVWRASHWMPHGYCLRWEPWLIGLHAISDSVVFGAYYLIAWNLLVIRRSAPDFPFPRLLLMFATLLSACGLTHFMDVWTLWRANYVVEGLVKVATAGATVATAFILIQAAPRIRALPRRVDLEAANRRLSEEVEERRRAEIELEIRTRALLRMNDSLQDFAYAASHNLREPLDRIQVSGRLLQSESGGLSPRATEFTNRMVRSAEHMDEMLAALLSYTRIDAKAPAFRLFSLDSVLDEALEDYEVEISKTAAQISRHPLPDIEGDPLQFRQLFGHLLSNALKFGKPGEPPRIQIGAEAGPPGWVQICVEDSGIGFGQRQATRMFDLFFRGFEHSELGGVGMGLPIARKIVERHGGRIRAEGSPGEYAKFIFTLPENQPRVQVGFLDTLKALGEKVAAAVTAGK